MNSFRSLVGWVLGCAVLPCCPAQSIDHPNVYAGMCDASAAVSLDPHSFVVANDEDNVIRIYEAQTNGLPKTTLDLNKFLAVGKSKKPETDIEGATWLGGRIFWITSHGRNREGKFRASRHRFLATRWVTNQGPARLEAVGRPYENLLRDLMREPRLQPFNLRRASTLAPKLPGALNIEGLCATPEGQLLLGFRNPVPNNQALVVPLLNPQMVIAGTAARFGEPRLLDLGGLGIRDMALVGQTYLIIAGPYHGGGESRLYRWRGGTDRPTRVDHPRLVNFNPEALVSYQDRPNQIQVLSDDGTLRMGGVACKDLPNSAARKFRSFWMDLTP